MDVDHHIIGAGMAQAVAVQPGVTQRAMIGQALDCGKVVTVTIELVASPPPVTPTILLLVVPVSPPGARWRRKILT